MAAVFNYGACQTACNAAAVACYRAEGLVLGAAPIAALPPAAAAAATACSAALGTCMAACAERFLAEGGAEVAASGGLTALVVAIGGAVLGAYRFFRFLISW